MQPDSRDRNGFVAHHKKRVRFVFLLAAFCIVSYHGVMHWHLVTGNVWNIPGFFFLAGSLPWSEIWWHLIRAETPQYLRTLFDILSVAIGVGINCAFAYLAVAAVAQWLRPKAPQP